MIDLAIVLYCTVLMLAISHMAYDVATEADKDIMDYAMLGLFLFMCLSYIIVIVIFVGIVMGI